jgi:hypothetical protein
MKRFLAAMVLIVAACSGSGTKSDGERDLDSGVLPDALNEAGLPRCPIVAPSGPCTELGLLCWSESLSECFNCRYLCRADGWQRECERCGYGECGIGGCKMPDGGCGSGRPTPLGYLCLPITELEQRGQPDSRCAPLALEAAPALDGCCRRDGTCGYQLESSCITPSVLLRDPNAVSVACPADAGTDGQAGDAGDGGDAADSGDSAAD